MNLIDLLFPKRCVGCRKTGSYFCQACIEDIKQGDLICPFCKRLAFAGVVHPVCKRKYGLDGLWSLGLYKDPLKKGIQKLKYKFVQGLAQDLVGLTIDYWARYQPFLLEQIKRDQGKSWVIVPVPLHKKRQNWRGFNQSAELAKLFASKLGLEYSESLIRVKNTTPQVKLKSEDRKQNIKNAFSLTPTSDLRAKNIILIDDVWTTGSTLKECCYVLKRGGSKTVWALTLAR